MEASKSKSKIVIMFDNIKQLELSNLDIGHSATDNNKRATVTSILIRFGKICSAVFSFSIILQELGHYRVSI